MYNKNRFSFQQLVTEWAQNKGKRRQECHHCRDIQLH